MQVSAEVRWFIDKSDLATPTDLWFKADGFVGGGGKERTDVYLKDSSEIGIKDRQGKPGLEIKVLVEPALGKVTFAEVEAKMELWSKVSSGSLVLPASESVKTVKTRWLRKFVPDERDFREIKLGGGPFGEDPVGEKMPDVGCNVEFTRVCLFLPSGREDWWTFGAEAFAFNQGSSTIEVVRETLHRLLRWLDSQPSRPSPMKNWNQLSYPGWLVRDGRENRTGTEHPVTRRE